MDDQPAPGRRRHWITGYAAGGRWVRKHWIGIAMVLIAIGFRFSVIESFRAPAGDGLQYYALSQSLLHDHRLAFSPPPAPLANTRLPGYPLFLAAVTLQAPLSLGEHLWRATHANALLDLATALLVFLLIRDRRLGRATAWAGFAAVIVCPILLFLSCYGLSESLATFLTTLTLYCSLKRGVIMPAIVGGISFGLLQLTRVDGLAILPPVALAFWLNAGSGRQLLERSLLFLVTAVVVFLPWPVRNLVQFGAPHVEGTAWMNQDGTALPYGFVRWMRSWGTGAPGEAFDLMAIARGRLLDVNRPGIVLPVMYDDENEHAEVVSLFERYNEEGLTPAVDVGFKRLAKQRRLKHPFRYYVKLPFSRLVAEWNPIPEWELPVQSDVLGLPGARAAYGHAEKVLFLFALLGAALLVRRDRRFAAVIGSTVIARSLLHAYAHPAPVERYLAECMPALLVLSAIGLSAVGTAVRGMTSRMKPAAAANAEAIKE